MIGIVDPRGRRSPPLRGSSGPITDGVGSSGRETHIGHDAALQACSTARRGLSAVVAAGTAGRWYLRGADHAPRAAWRWRFPSFIAYRYLRGKVERIVVEMEKIAVKFADSLGASRRATKPTRHRAHRMKLGLRKPKEDPEINLISLIDIALLLVIFFMLSSTFMQEGRLKIELPQASLAPTGKQKSDPLVVTVTQAASIASTIES